MRALVPIKSGIDLLTPEGQKAYLDKNFKGKTHREEFLRKILRTRNWLVEDSERARGILEFVMADVSGEDADDVRGQWLLSLYSEEKGIKGILGVRDNHFVEIRLRSSAISDVKELSSALVQLFMEADKEARASKSGALVFAVSFPESAKIYSSHTKEQVWKGDIHPESARQMAFKEQQGQVVAYRLAWLIFAVSLVATFPRVDSLYLKYMVDDIGKWLVGFVERLPSAALLTVVFTRLAIQMRIQELKKDGFIFWTPV